MVEKKVVSRSAFPKALNSGGKKKVSIAKKIKKNPWILTTLILSVLCVIFIAASFSSFGMLSNDQAAQGFVDFINSRGDSQIEYVNSESFGSSLYQVTVLSDGQEVPAHITKDGKYFVQIVSPIGEVKEEPKKEVKEEVKEDAEIVKSNKPVVELFIMSHCPYGTQAEKGILPVAELLADKIDFNIRFVYYAMHPSYGEVEEQLNQYCIQGEQEELYNDYLTCFLKEGDGEACLTEVGVDKSKLSNCYATADEEFNVLANLADESSWLSGRYPKFDIHKSLNELYDIGGSPTLVINGKVVSSGRAPANYLDSICQTFNDSPAECGASLSTSSYDPGFGYSVSSGSNSGSAAQCG